MNGILEYFPDKKTSKIKKVGFKIVKEIFILKILRNEEKYFKNIEQAKIYKNLSAIGAVFRLTLDI